MFAEPLGTNRTHSGGIDSPNDSQGQLGYHSQDTALQFMTPTQDTTTNVQLHSPLTDDSSVNLQPNFNFTPEAASGSQEPHASVHSSPLRGGISHHLLDGAGASANLAAMQSSLTALSLVQVGWLILLPLPCPSLLISSSHIMYARVCTSYSLQDSSINGITDGHHQSPASAGGASTSMSDNVTGGWRELSPDHLQGSTGVSPIKPMQLPSTGDETVVYGVMRRPLPDYALNHVFAQCGPGVYGWRRG
jgi:hypothetical protein